MSDAPVTNDSSADRSRSLRTRAGVFQRHDRSSQEFVSSVRSIDLSQASDEELRERVKELSMAHSTTILLRNASPSSTRLSAANRAWQVFDPAYVHSEISRYRDAPHDLTGTDKTIAETLAYVSVESTSRYFADIDLPAEFYRAIRESSLANALRFEPTNEQIAAGRLMLDRTVVEMDAGEGKTVAAAFPAITQALSERKVHVITANDYLALRDAELLAPAYEFLGLTVGVCAGSHGRR